MGKHKHKKSSQFPAGNKQAATSSVSPTSLPEASSSVVHRPLADGQSITPLPSSHHLIQPEQMSLSAYQHIQLCLHGRSQLDKREVTAILQLAQHLRVFGLLSAVGYLSHAKDGETKKYTSPMWKPLLWRLLHETEALPEDAVEKALMKLVEEMARTNPQLYMVTWRRALLLSNHWNFWAKAHQKEEQANVHRTETT